MFDAEKELERLPKDEVRTTVLPWCLVCPLPLKRTEALA